jgi:hypothetical protein
MVEHGELMIEAKAPFITVVSGLPRTGTSMMMRFLSAGGMEVLTDNHRKADDDNPGGYFELERVKQLKCDNEWLDAAQGKAIKVIYRLLYDLPPRYQYKVIFMRRHLTEVVASQKVMLARQQRKGSALADGQLLAAFSAEIAKVEYWIQARPDFELLSLDFNNTIDDPVKAATEISRFLGCTLDVAQMSKVVDPALYRQRIDRLGAPASGT